jgi:hypothetical protein
MGHVSDEIMDLYMHSLSEDRDIAVASVMSNLAHLMTDAPVDARVQ